MSDLCPVCEEGVMKPEKQEYAVTYRGFKHNTSYYTDQCNYCGCMTLSDDRDRAVYEFREFKRVVNIKLKPTPKTLDDLVLLYYHETNPVTKAVRKDILDKKIYQEYTD